MYQYILVCTSTCWYVLVCTDIYIETHVLVCTSTGNSAPTIPHKFSKHKGSAFPMGSADTANDDGRRGSNVYEVSNWLWMFGRGKASLGGLSVAETAVRKSARHEDQVKRAHLGVRPKKIS